jgi:UDP-2-acetamido-2,6-beta-L-arabino-hexul-4-ose reductase
LRIGYLGSALWKNKNTHTIIVKNLLIGMNIEVKQLPSITDERGWLAEILKSELKEPIGQIHFSVSKQGVARGNHYHKHRIEWLFVTNGTGTVFLEDNVTGEKSELMVSGSCPTLVKICPDVTHAIVNISQEPMCLLVISNEKHSVECPDTYRKQIYPP